MCAAGVAARQPGTGRDLCAGCLEEQERQDGLPLRCDGVPRSQSAARHRGNRRWLRDCGRGIAPRVVAPHSTPRFPFRLAGRSASWRRKNGMRRRRRSSTLTCEPVSRSRLRAQTHARILGIIAHAAGLLDKAVSALRGRPGLQPQGRLPAGAGLDLLRLRRPAAPAQRSRRRRAGGGAAGRRAGHRPRPGHAAAHGAHPGAARVLEGVDDDYVKAPGIRCHALERQLVSPTVPPVTRG